MLDSSLPGFSFNSLVFDESPAVLKEKGEAKKLGGNPKSGLLASWLLL
jgi:hypothetical protein